MGGGERGITFKIKMLRTCARWMEVLRQNLIIQGGKLRVKLNKYLSLQVLRDQALKSPNRKETSTDPNKIRENKGRVCKGFLGS